MIPEPDDSWKPMLYTPPLSPDAYTQGDDLADFTELLLKANTGFREGEPLILMDWQKWLVQSMLEEKEDGYLRYRRVLVGLPKKNGKTFLAAVILLYFLFYGPKNAQLFCAATSSDQASLVFNEAAKMVESSTQLSKIMKVYRGSEKRIESKITGGIIKPLAADAKTADGIGPYIVVADELHRWTGTAGEEFWKPLSEGSGHLPEAMLIAITTAGSHRGDDILSRLYNSGESIIMGKTKDDTTGMFWWGADGDDDFSDPGVWKKANPNLAAGMMSMDEMQSSFANAELMGFNGFLRYRLNIWLPDGAESTWVTSAQLEKNERKDYKIEAGKRLVLGFDGSKVDDSTALVAIDIDAGVMFPVDVWEKDDSNPDWVVPRSEVNAAIDRVFEENEVLKLYADVSYFETDSQAWAEKYGADKIASIAQHPTTMGTHARRLKFDMVFLDSSNEHPVYHNGDARLVSHMLAAIQEDRHGNIKKQKKKGSKIDLAVAGVLANGAKYEALHDLEVQRKKRGRRIISG